MRYRLRTLLISFAIGLLLTVSAAAQNETDPTGTWTWQFPNQSAQWTLKLALKTDKLTGSIKHSRNAPEQPIEDATFRDGVVVFKRRYKTRDGEDAVATFSGTISNNTITGTAMFDRPGSVQPVKWEATREQK